MASAQGASEAWTGEVRVTRFQVRLKAELRAPADRSGAGEGKARTHPCRRRLLVPEGRSQRTCVGNVLRGIQQMSSEWLEIHTGDPRERSRECQWWDT